MSEDFEPRVMQALVDHAGPPEIAAQLVALATVHELTDELLPWIRFHVGEEWSAGQFNAWCWKFRRTMNELKGRGKSA